MHSTVLSRGSTAPQHQHTLIPNCQGQELLLGSRYTRIRHRMCLLLYRLTPCICCLLQAELANQIDPLMLRVLEKCQKHRDQVQGCQV
jgi:hypothetical protein